MGRICVVAPSAGDAWRRRSAQPDPEAAGRPDEAACGPAAAGQRQRQRRGGLAGRPEQRRCAGGGYCRPAGACCQPGVRAAVQLEGVCRQLPGGAGGGLGASWEGACRQRAARASRCGGRPLAATGRSLRSSTAAPCCMLRAAPALPAAGGGRPARAYCHRSRASGLPRLMCLATTYDSFRPALGPFHTHLTPPGVRRTADTTSRWRTRSWLQDWTWARTAAIPMSDCLYRAAGRQEMRNMRGRQQEMRSMRSRRQGSQGSQGRDREMRGRRAAATSSGGWAAGGPRPTSSFTQTS